MVKKAWVSLVAVPLGLLLAAQSFAQQGNAGDTVGGAANPG